MPDVLLFGATGYTGRLTAEALSRKGADFVVAGRDHAKLEEVAARTGAADARVAKVGDVDALVRALEDVAAIITCVGPFGRFGDTAAEAAVRAGVHYVDSTGEGDFIDYLIERYGRGAQSAGIVMAPAMGFDEVPSDTALSLACEGLASVRAIVTYSFPSHASAGTLRTIVTGIAGRDARWIRDGEMTRVVTGSRQRWAPMPAPLGPKLSIAMPAAESRLAPLHLDVRDLELYFTAERVQAAAMRFGVPVAKPILAARPVTRLLEALVDRLPDGPDEVTRRRDRWTILAEARSGDAWRNVTLHGTDPYGLTAETLAFAGITLARGGHEGAGVMAPVQALGLERVHKELIDLGTEVQIYEPA